MMSRSIPGKRGGLILEAFNGPRVRRSREVYQETDSEDEQVKMNPEE